MGNPIRVMVERGKKKRTVASAFHWSGWDRSGKTEEEALHFSLGISPRRSPHSSSHSANASTQGKRRVEVEVTPYAPRRARPNLRV
jgi:hypothetical protein